MFWKIKQIKYTEQVQKRNRVLQSKLETQTKQMI